MDHSDRDIADIARACQGVIDKKPNDNSQQDGDEFTGPMMDEEAVKKCFHCLSQFLGLSWLLKSVF